DRHGTRDDEGPAGAHPLSGAATRPDQGPVRPCGCDAARHGVRDRMDTVRRARAGRHPGGCGNRRRRVARGSPAVRLLPGPRCPVPAACVRGGKDREALRVAPQARMGDRARRWGSPHPDGCADDRRTVGPALYTTHPDIRSGGMATAMNRRGKGMIRRLRRALVLGAIMVVILPATASAHAGFVSSTPQPGAILGSAPGQVSVTFSEPLNARLSRVAVRTPDGSSVAGNVVGDDGMVVDLTSGQPGVYEVDWTTVSLVDGHTPSGSFR